MAVITLGKEVGDIKVIKFLDLIAFSEGTSTIVDTRNDGYDVIVTGIHGMEVFTDYSHHPFLNRPPQKINAHLSSTAAGRYQELLHNYDFYSKQLHLPDFSPLSQDLIALQHMKERGAIAHIHLNEIQTAISLCSNIWASFPGNNYQQGGKAMSTLMAHWNSL
jgi:muramidase (phage lysozyme)